MARMSQRWRGRTRRPKKHPAGRSSGGGRTLLDFGGGQGPGLGLSSRFANNEENQQRAEKGGDHPRSRGRFFRLIRCRGCRKRRRGLRRILGVERQGASHGHQQGAHNPRKLLHHGCIRRTFSRRAGVRAWSRETTTTWAAAGATDSVLLLHVPRETAVFF